MTYQFVENSGSATWIGNVLYFYGSTASGIYTVGSGNTVTFAAYDWTTAQKGVGLLATTSSATTGTETTTAVTPQGLSSKLGVQTLYALPVSQGSASSFTWRGPLTNGQLLIGSNNNYPVAATLTPGTGIAITNASGGITITSTTILSIARYVYTYTGVMTTYMPAASALFCDVEVVGGGGGGGGAGTSINKAVAVGGGGGGYARKIFPIATIGSSQSFTVGTGGAGGVAGNNTGTAGGTTSFGLAPLLYATGGSGGTGSADTVNLSVVSGVTGGSGYLGDENATGGGGSASIGIYCSLLYPPFALLASSAGGSGGNSVLGGGAYGVGVPVSTSAAGVDGGAYGGGGSGGVTNNSSQVKGGDGATGVLIITEYRAS